MMVWTVELYVVSSQGLLPTGTTDWQSVVSDTLLPSNMVYSYQLYGHDGHGGL